METYTIDNSWAPGAAMQRVEMVLKQGCLGSKSLLTMSLFCFYCLKYGHFIELLVA